MAAGSLPVAILGADRGWEIFFLPTLVDTEEFCLNLRLISYILSGAIYVPVFT